MRMHSAALPARTALCPWAIRAETMYRQAVTVGSGAARGRRLVSEGSVDNHLVRSALLDAIGWGIDLAASALPSVAGDEHVRLRECLEQLGQLAEIRGEHVGRIAGEPL